jgi:phosphoglycolate phosphatase-like HAD superfamily hydrolase
MRLVWLFDVDGTLIRTFGTARQSFSTAIRSVLGIEDGLEDLIFAGGLDPRILDNILARLRVTMTDAQKNRFWEIVHQQTAASLEAGRGVVLPGVHSLLKAIAAEPAWTAGLLTGNGAAMAKLKLGHFRLLDSFAFASFGDEAEDRDALACLAVARAEERWKVAPDRCIVVGDTENDIRCARAAGAWVVAVATGTRTRSDLALESPDLLLDDLGDTAGLMDWARALANAAPAAEAPRL